MSITVRFITDSSHTFSLWKVGGVRPERDKILIMELKCGLYARSGGCEGKHDDQVYD